MLKSGRLTVVRSAVAVMVAIALCSCSSQKPMTEDKGRPKNVDEVIEREDLPFKLSTLPLGPDVTKYTIRVAWGRPNMTYAVGSVWLYLCVEKENEVYLWFGPGPKFVLRKASVLSHGENSDGVLKTLYDADPKPIRAMSDIEISEKLHGEDVFAVWGPPDVITGFGAESDEYFLSNGTSVKLQFPSGPRDHLTRCSVFNPVTGTSTVLFPKNWVPATQAGASK